MISKSLFSSATVEWATPQALFDELNAEFGFSLDVCATVENAKCKAFYTKEQDGLKQPWTGRVWCNPPYGKAVGNWIAKAQQSARFGEAELVVMLIRSATDTKYFHRYIWDRNRNMYRPGVEVRFPEGRLKFGNAATSAPFPSVIVIFNFN